MPPLRLRLQCGIFYGFKTLQPSLCPFLSGDFSLNITTISFSTRTDIIVICSSDVAGPYRIIILWAFKDVSRFLKKTSCAAPCRSHLFPYYIYYHKELFIVRSRFGFRLHKTCRFCTVFLCSLLPLEKKRFFSIYIMCILYIESKVHGWLRNIKIYTRRITEKNVHCYYYYSLLLLLQVETDLFTYAADFRFGNLFRFLACSLLRVVLGVLRGSGLERWIS